MEAVLTDNPAVQLDQRGGVLTVTLNRPEVLNAFNDAMTRALLDALAVAARDSAIRAVLLAGAGRAFSAGQDLNEFATLDRQSRPGSVHDHLAQTYNPIVTQIRTIEKPVLAALNGITAGVGLSVALACDLRLAADDATFTLGFSRIGLVPDGGASLLLPLLVGLGRATELAFTSDRVDAREAHRIGLVNRVAPAAELLEESHALAARLAAMPTRALGLTKRAFNRALLPELAGWLDYEAHLQEIASRTEDHQEGVAAFREKRQATFTGR